MSEAGAGVETQRARRRVVAVPPGAEFLSIAQAEALGVACAATIRGWIRAGKLKRYGEGRLWRVRRVELLALMERGGRAAEKPAEAQALSILQKAGH